MGVKRIIKYFYLSVKAAGKVMWVPVLIINLALPLINFYFYKEAGLCDVFWWHVIEYEQYAVPLCSVWWSIFYMREYLEGEGCELLCIMVKRPYMYCVVLSGIILVNVAVWFCAFSLCEIRMLPVFFRICILSAFHFGISCFALAISRSSIISLLFVIMYDIIVFINPLAERSFLFYINCDFITWQELFSEALFYVPVSVALLAAAEGFCKLRHRMGLFG